VVTGLWPVLRLLPDSVEDPKGDKLNYQNCRTRYSYACDKRQLRVVRQQLKQE